MTTKVSSSPLSVSKMTVAASDSHSRALMEEYQIILRAYIGLPTSTYQLPPGMGGAKDLTAANRASQLARNSEATC